MLAGFYIIVGFICNSISGSFCLVFWRNLSLVKGTAELTPQHRVLQEDRRQVLLRVQPPAWAGRTAADPAGAAREAEAEQ